MDISNLITKLMASERNDKEIYVKMYTRNSFGEVIEAVRFPIAAAFAYNPEKAEIIIEKSQVEKVTI